MPRQGRIDAVGVLHHIMQRGIERRKIFDAKIDCAAFVERLGKVLMDSGTSCYAWALMPNHLHLLLRTGAMPIGRVMQRLFTWYAGYYNGRRGRSGHLFQNRFKSIICDEDSYFLELVRYIHLNPLRAGVVRDMNGLATYDWCGHQAVMGRRSCEWQDVASVLSEFGRRKANARREYVKFVHDGVPQGHRREFEGGGVVRSVGGVMEYIKARKSGEELVGDQRILGEGEFVSHVLEEAEKAETRRSKLRRGGGSIEVVLGRVANVMGLEKGSIIGNGKRRSLCEARSLACYWLVRELGYSGGEVAAALQVTRAAVSIGIPRGEAVARTRKLALEGK